MLVRTHACIHSGENSRHDLYSTEKLQFWKFSQFSKDYECTVYLCYYHLATIS